MAAIRARHAAPQRRPADARVPDAAHIDFCARQLRADLDHRRCDPLPFLLPAVLAGPRNACLRHAARGRDHQRPAAARRTRAVAQGPLALLRELASGAAPRFRYGQRRQRPLDAVAQCRLSDRRRRMYRLPRLSGVADDSAGARSRAGSDRGVRAVPDDLAAQRAARLKLGTPLGNAGGSAAFVTHRSREELHGEGSSHRRRRGRKAATTACRCAGRRSPEAERSPGGARPDARASRAGDGAAARL